MIRDRSESAQNVNQRRDGALRSLVEQVPYLGFLGVQFDRRGDDLTAVLPFNEILIGNPRLPALHGGATAAFLEITATIGLSWATLWDDIESGALQGLEDGSGVPPGLPKTIDLTVEYLRSGFPRDSYARAQVTRSGRRYATVHVTAWQDERDRPFAQATGNFLMAPR